MGNREDDNVVPFRRPPRKIQINFPKWLPQWLFTTVTGWLILTNVGIYLAMVAASLGSGILTPFPGRLTFWLGDNEPTLLRAQPWRLLTSTFLHADIMHVGMNMLALWLFGRRLEDALGKARFAIVYLVTGLAASGASAAWHLFVVSGSSVGASGAIMGVLGTLGGLTWMGLGRNHPLTKSYVQYALIGFAVGIVSNLIGSGRLDNAAHVGGWLAGLGLARIVAGRRPIKGLAQTITLAFCGLLVPASFAAAMFTPEAASNAVLTESVDKIRDELNDAQASGDTAREEKAWLAAIASAPKSMPIRVSHASVLDKLGRTDDAKQELLAAAALDGTPDDWTTLAQALHAKGENDAARKAAANAFVKSNRDPRFKRLYDEYRNATPAPSPS